MAKILHIEDDPNSRRLVEKLLRAAGHEIVETSSGLDGVHLARTRQPELVLVDINVPDMDGYEVILRLRGLPTLRGIPIVAITAEGDRETVMSVGANGFLPKPINAREFAQQIATFLEPESQTLPLPKDPPLREQSQRIVERLEGKLTELREANARLEEFARLRREFLQNVSHELATPMTPVVGYLKLLLGGELGELTELQRKCLMSVARSTRRLRKITDTLLDVSALRPGRMHYYDQDYDFAQVAQLAIDDMTRDTDDQRTLLGALPPQPLPARGDPDKLRRALLHILDNAVKFTKPQAQIAFEVASVGDRYAFTVVDSGPGIGEDEQERILEPFYQVDGSATRRYGGVGLGLAFARRVASALGGELIVQSPPSRAVAGHHLSGTLITLSVAKRATPML